MSNLPTNQQAPKASLVVGEGVILEGKVNTPGALRLHGRIDGDVVVGDIYVGNNGCINGTLIANNAEICGTVSEKIVVQRQLTLRSTATARGSIEYGALEIEHGAKINAKVTARNTQNSDVEGSEISKTSSELQSSDQPSSQDTQASSTKDQVDDNDPIL